MPLAKALGAAFAALALGCQGPSLPPWDQLYWNVPERRADEYAFDRSSCLAATPRVSHVSPSGIPKPVPDWDAFVECMRDRGWRPG